MQICQNVSHSVPNKVFGPIVCHMSLSKTMPCTRVGDTENWVLELLPRSDLRLLQYCNYTLILSMIAKIGSFFKKITFLILVLRAYGSRLCVIVSFNCIYYNYYLIAARQYFAIATILADQNHVIWLLQWDNIAMYAIYWIIAQSYHVHM